MHVCFQSQKRRCTASPWGIARSYSACERGFSSLTDKLHADVDASPATWRSLPRSHACASNQPFCQVRRSSSSESLDLVVVVIYATHGTDLQQIKVLVIAHKIERPRISAEQSTAHCLVQTQSAFAHKVRQFVDVQHLLRTVTVQPVLCCVLPLHNGFADNLPHLPAFPVATLPVQRGKRLRRNLSEHHLGLCRQKRILYATDVEAAFVADLVLRCRRQLEWYRTLAHGARIAKPVAHDVSLFGKTETKCR